MTKTALLQKMLDNHLYFVQYRKMLWYWRTQGYRP